MTEENKVAGEQQVVGTPPSPDGKTVPSAVPYHQYIGVKEMLNKEEVAHQTTRSQLNALQSQVLEREGQVKALETQLNQVKSSSIDPQAHEALKTEHQNLVTGLLELHKVSLVQQYGVDPAKIKDMTADKLEVFEEGLKTAAGMAKATPVDSTPKPDMGGGSGTPAPSTTLGYLKNVFESGEVLKSKSN